MILNLTPYIGLRGDSNLNSKITSDQAHSICTLLSTTSLSYEQIARKTKSTKDIVNQIKRRRTWMHISIHYPLRDNKNPA